LRIDFFLSFPNPVNFLIILTRSIPGIYPIQGHRSGGAPALGASPRRESNPGKLRIHRSDEHYLNRAIKSFSFLFMSPEGFS
jgi:hypothetical protein